MNQLNFFSVIESKIRSEVNDPSRISKIKGLTYIPDYINQYEHDKLLEILDYSNNWSNELRRRVQHYGYKYNYISRSINTSMRIGVLPDWCLGLAERFSREGLTKELPDQVIVNEYQPGQGIAKHIDCEPCFKETIISLSLGSDCVINFTHQKTLEEMSVLLEARSLIVMERDARYVWLHSIAPRKIDKIGNLSFQRERRISITFRKVILSNEINT
jgi:alkylated DNA repair dioxygenase AlkB